MVEYASTVAEQGTHKWVGVLVDTGAESLLGVTYSGYEFTQADVDEATSMGGGAGVFVLWLKMDEVAQSAKSFVLAGADKDETTVTVTVA
jgi:hypothetical protein